jgi:hypothetical protein
MEFVFPKQTLFTLPMNSTRKCSFYIADGREEVSGNVAARLSTQQEKYTGEAIYFCPERKNSKFSYGSKLGRTRR